MHDHVGYQLRLANDRIAERIQEAADARLADPHRTPIRRSLGHSIIRIGERLAAEPPMNVARSR